MAPCYPLNPISPSSIKQNAVSAWFDDPVPYLSQAAQIERATGVSAAAASQLFAAYANVDSGALDVDGMMRLCNDLGVWREPRWRISLSSPCFSGLPNDSLLCHRALRLGSVLPGLSLAVRGAGPVHRHIRRILTGLAAAAVRHVGCSAQSCTSVTATVGRPGHVQSGMCFVVHVPY